MCAADESEDVVAAGLEEGVASLVNNVFRNAAASELCFDAGNKDLKVATEQ